MSWIKDKVFNNADDFLKWLDDNFGDYISKHINENHVHHTYRPNHSNYPKNTTLQLHKNMRNFHVSTNKWDDIAQNITIGKDGDIVTGRDIRKIPISAKGYNGSTNWHPFAYEMIGNFDRGNDVFGGKQLESAIKISRYFYLKNKGIKFHRELLINGKQPKTCPGTGIDKNWFMGLVKDKKYDVKKEQEIKVEPLQVAWDVVKVVSSKYGIYSEPLTKWKEDSFKYVGWIFVTRQRQVVNGQTWYHLYLGDVSYGWISGELVEKVPYTWANTTEKTVGYLHADFKYVAGSIDPNSKIAIIDEQDDKYLIVSSHRPQWVKKIIVEL